MRHRWQIVVEARRGSISRQSHGSELGHGLEPFSGQAVAAGNIQISAARLDVQERGERGPAKQVQDVYKKPYTFLLTFPRNLAFTKYPDEINGKAHGKGRFGREIIH